MANNVNKHIETGIDTGAIISSYDVSMGVVTSTTYDPDGSAPTELRHIGLISGFSISDGRNVTQQGEIGSNYLLTLINEGQKSMSFQRLVPFPVSIEAGAPLLNSGSILRVLYDHLLGSNPGKLLIDIEQYPEFNIPIHIMLTFVDKPVGTLYAKIVLYNALVSGANMSLGAGSKVTMEPTQIMWERTVQYPIT